MKQIKFITLLFSNGEFEYFDVVNYIKHHQMRNDEPVDWQYFIEEESGYNPETIVGYLLSEKDPNTLINLINL